jgi:hypothetical protein
MPTFKIIGADQNEYGPVPLEDLRRWITEGRANAQTRVQREGSAEWVTLAQVPEVADLLAPAPQVPPTLAEAPTPVPTDVLARDYDVDITGCISRAWRLLQENFGMLFGGALVYLLLQFGMSALAQIPLIGLLFSLASLVIGGPLIGGLYFFLLKYIRRQPAEIGDVFAGFKLAFVPLMLGYIVVLILSMCAALPGGILAGIGTYLAVEQKDSALPIAIALISVGGILLLIPLIYLSVAWWFTLPLIMDKRIDFWQAMNLSRKVVNKHWWLWFAFVIVIGLLNLAGMLVCCVGMLVTFPLTMLAALYAYEDVFSSRPPA